jgi:hypothetical protein
LAYSRIFSVIPLAVYNPLAAEISFYAYSMGRLNNIGTDGIGFAENTAYL